MSGSSTGSTKGACVLDASAVLALLQAEPGHAVVQAHVERGNCCMSSVNVTEVLTQLIDRGMSPEDAEAALDALEIEVIAFDDVAARAAAALRVTTRAQGLSIGDRACLAVAALRKSVAVTADRAWKDVDCGVRVELIRQAS